MENEVKKWGPSNKWSKGGKKRMIQLRFRKNIDLNASDYDNTRGSKGAGDLGGPPPSPKQK